MVRKHHFLSTESIKKLFFLNCNFINISSHYICKGCTQLTLSGSRDHLMPRRMGQKIFLYNQYPQNSSHTFLPLEKQSLPSSPSPAIHQQYPSLTYTCQSIPWLHS